MREIINPWVGMNGYCCFGCSPQNPLGTQMRFYEEGVGDEYADIISVWQPSQQHQSWINTLHGGIQATLLDEVCGWVVFKKLRTSGVTAKMELRYKNAVSTVNGPLVLKARLKSNNHHVALVEGEICDTEGKLLTQCECTYFSFSEDKAREMGYVEAALGNEDISIEEAIKRAIEYKPLRLGAL